MARGIAHMCQQILFHWRSGKLNGWPSYRLRRQHTSSSSSNHILTHGIGLMGAKSNDYLVAMINYLIPRNNPGILATIPRN